MNRNQRRDPVIKVIHKINQRVVTTRCRHIRDARIGGFVELSGILDTNLRAADGVEMDEQIDTLLLPRIVVIAICYPRDAGDGVVLLHPAAEHEHQASSEEETQPPEDDPDED